jgi:ATP phosphoribosyltransferase regulatory subunit
MAGAPSLSREDFLAPFVAAGYAAVEPPILQPAELFLDLSGEDLARRLYLTTDAEGTEFCLRPELTIPVCRLHVSSGDPGRAGDYCYHGLAFRHRPGASGEHVQAGVESLGRRDTAAADADVFLLALECLARHGLPEPRVRLGDTGLFRAVLAALDLPAAWTRRLARDFGRADLVDADLAAILAPGAAERSSGVLRAMAGADPAGARALVEDLLRIGGLSAVGGRTVGEIAERFLERAELSHRARIAPAELKLLQDLLAAAPTADAAAETCAAILRPLGPALKPALEALAARHDALKARGARPERFAFEPAFGRRLDYYTGFVFEMHDPAGGPRHVVGGGRYDGLLALLGAPEPSPAVGFTCWVERLPGAGA